MIESEQRRARPGSVPGSWVGFYTIGEVSKMLGVAATTLRGWERYLGLDVNRDRYKNRQFSKIDVAKLRYVQKIKQEVGMFTRFETICELLASMPLPEETHASTDENTSVPLAYDERSELDAVERRSFPPVSFDAMLRHELEQLKEELIYGHIEPLRKQVEGLRKDNEQLRKELDSRKVVFKIITDERTSIETAIGKGSE